MEIEIVTTKKKITKSMINQMPIASSYQMQSGQVLGYVLNVVPGSYKTGLLIYCGNPYKFYTNWIKSESKKAIYRKTRKNYAQRKEFDSELDCHEWWENYQRCLGLLYRQIYI